MCPPKSSRTRNASAPRTSVSLTMVNGFTGQFSMGHAAFMLVGGYTAAMIMSYGSMLGFGDVRLATLVFGITYRHPAVLAKWATTTDHVSSGRLLLGLGAGWQENEHQQYGIRLGPPGERVERDEPVVEPSGASTSAMPLPCCCFE